MYPEYLKILLDADKKTTGEAHLTIDTIDKARRVAIFFDEHKFEKKYKLDTKSSCCLQDDLKVEEKEVVEMEPL